MYKILAVFFCLFVSAHLTAQIFPQEGSHLCWRIIGFVFADEKDASSYKIEIASGWQTNEIAFKKNIVATAVGKKNKIIAEVPSFGCAYTWRIVSTKNSSAKTNGGLHHFSVKIVADVDTTHTRLRILKAAEKYKDDYVLLDGERVIYDMKGRPVWFLPGIDLPENREAYPRDMKVTPQGTLTFITNQRPYEITYNGDIKWVYSDNANTDTFHHVFTRLHNGHYMAMISSVKSDKNNFTGNGLRKSNVTDIAEFDAHSHTIWRWSGLNYINNSDLKYIRYTDGQLNDFDLHENAFYFDEKNKIIYLSFRNINRIIKIKYPEGNVLDTYGPVYGPDGKRKGNSFFCGQHSCKVSGEGDLYVYNNNTCGVSHIPTILVFQQLHGKNELKKIWEYDCTIEDPGIAGRSDLLFPQGGSVFALPGGDMFVGMSRPYSKVFIVSHDKKILWSALPEQYDAAAQKWKQPDSKLIFANIVTRKQLEQLIWNALK